MLSRNIRLGEEIIQQVANLKNAEETLTCANVPIEEEYWNVNLQSSKDKMKIFLKLWQFPEGGGKLTKTKVQQMDALKKFNLTKNGIESRVEECKDQV